ncbi:MAG TPA: YlmH/Sll1252 family protein [Bacillales bacterium]|nr:YlmH/Sll1252 family protein [Bacillales bacterium]
MDLYQHFRPEEKPFIDELLESAEEVAERYMPKLFDFLDPRQQQMAENVIGANQDVTLSFAGGSSYSERKRLLLMPPYQQAEEGAHGLLLFTVDYPRKFTTIRHRDLLGSLMGIGLKREKFGDLLLKDGQVQIVVAKEIASYVKLNLTKVGNSPVSLEETELKHILMVPKVWNEQSGTVSSLRLDTVLAEIYGVSRGKSSEWIEKDRVKVNWRTVEQSSYLLQQGDELSVRGKGRSKVIAIEGKTKKGKYRIISGRLDENRV